MDDNKLLNDYLKDKKHSNSKISKFITKTLICLILFFCLSIACKISDKNSKFIHKYLYENNFDFVDFNKIYSKFTKGSNETKLVSLEIFDYISKEQYLNGEKYILNEDTPVKAITDGIVVYIGQKDNLGNTLILQGSNGFDFWYSGLDFPDIKLYDYIKTDSIIASGKELILTIVKDNKYYTYEEYKNS